MLLKLIKTLILKKPTSDSEVLLENLTKMRDYYVNTFEKKYNYNLNDLIRTTFFYSTWVLLRIDLLSQFFDAKNAHLKLLADPKSNHSIYSYLSSYEGNLRDDLLLSTGDMEDDAIRLCLLCYKKVLGYADTLVPREIDSFCVPIKSINLNTSNKVILRHPIFNFLKDVAANHKLLEELVTSPKTSKVMSPLEIIFRDVEIKAKQLALASAYGPRPESLISHMINHYSELQNDKFDTDRFNYLLKKVFDIARQSTYPNEFLNLYDQELGKNNNSHELYPLGGSLITG